MQDRRDMSRSVPSTAPILATLSVRDRQPTFHMRRRRPIQIINTFNSHVSSIPVIHPLLHALLSSDLHLPWIPTPSLRCPSIIPMGATTLCIPNPCSSMGKFLPPSRLWTLAEQHGAEAATPIPSSPVLSMRRSSSPTPRPMRATTWPTSAPSSPTCA
jgi:hypothetical protein